jgi:branched-chain amino acid transport system substrate-binding protein
VRKKRLVPLAIGLALALGAAACGGSSSGSTGSGSSNSSGGTIKIGVLADLTGAASSGFVTAEKGVKAYVDSVNAAGGVNGQKLTYVMGDMASSPAGALTAARALVQRDKVFAVIVDGADNFGAQPYLLQQGIPVIGGAFDGPEWTVQSNTNLFASVGVTNYDQVSTATGQFMKEQGVTSCGSIAYATSKSSQQSAVGIVKSCTAAGLKQGYLNTEVPYGSTDVGAIAVAIKKAGVDGLELPVVPNTAFALVAQLKQLGVPVKAVLLATGYGSDLLASSAAVQAAQGYYFASVGQPAEANTPATQKMAANLAKEGVTGSPTFAEQEGYIAASALVAGLKAAGKNPTQASFMKSLRGITDFDADGLLAPAKVNFSDYSPFGTASGPGGCLFVVQLKGSAFKNTPGSPICGTTVPGVTTG